MSVADKLHLYSNGRGMLVPIGILIAILIAATGYGALGQRVTANEQSIVASKVEFEREAIEWRKWREEVNQRLTKIETLLEKRRD